MPPDRGLARLLERRLASALAVLALLPLAWVAVHVGRHAVQVPVHDQWNVQVPIAIRAAAGTLAARDLLAPYQEHRYLLTRAWTAVNARLFGWDLRLDALVNVLIALGSLLALLALLRRQQADAGAVAAVLFSALLLSPRQRWTWGLLSSFGGIVLLLALALGTLTRAGALVAQAAHRRRPGDARHVERRARRRGLAGAGRRGVARGLSPPRTRRRVARGERGRRGELSRRVCAAADGRGGRRRSRALRRRVPRRWLRAGGGRRAAPRRRRRRARPGAGRRRRPGC